MTFRKAIFWLHLCAGCIAGAIVLVMSVTGVALTYERQMIAWFDAGQRAQVTGAGPRKALADLLAAQPKPPDSVTLRPGPLEPVALAYGREGTVYVDPYTGARLGEGHTGARKFFQSMTAWHRWLGQEGPGRQTARAITGACNLAFLFLVVSGLVLWWPRRWTPAALRAVTLFQGKATGKARDFNWHNVIGFWSLVPLFFVVATGVVMSYPWANELVYKLTGSEVPVQRAGGPPRGGGGPEGRSRRAPSYDGIDTLVAAAKEVDPQWQILTFRPGGPRRAPMTFTLDRAERGRPDLRTTVSVARDSASVVKVERFSDQNAGRRLRTWIRWVHTGEAGGVLGQTLAGLVSLGGVFLVYTGIALSLRRLAAWRRRRHQRFLEASRALG